VITMMENDCSDSCSFGVRITVIIVFITVIL